MDRVTFFNSRFSTCILCLLLLFACNTENEKIIINPPKADFTFEPNVVNTLQGKFINNSTSIKSFIWNFGDGKVNTSVRSPLYTYKNPGTYSVTLTVVGWNDVEVTTTKDIVVTTPAAVNFIQNNSFTNAASWTVTTAFGPGENITTSFNNKLTLSVPAQDQVGILIHQAVNLQPGTYQFALDFDIDAIQYNAWAEIYFLSATPVEGVEPEDPDKVIGYNSFGDCLEVAFAGDILTVPAGCLEGEHVSNAQVVVTTAGTYYFTIYTGVYDGTYGDSFNINSVGLFKLN